MPLKIDEYNENLRRNPPEVRVTSGQKPCTKIIYIVLKTSVDLFSISSKNNSILTTPNIENEGWTSYKTLKVRVKWNWWWNFACVCTKPLNFEIYLLSLPGNLFSVLFQAIIYVFSFKKM